MTFNLPHTKPYPTMNEVDRKWLDALEQAYPVVGGIPPFFRYPDGSLDAERTLQSYFRLVGLELESDGRIKDGR